MTKWKRYFARDLQASAQHVLQWAISPDFERSMRSLLQGAGAELREPDHRFPNGHYRSSTPPGIELEEYLARFPSAHRQRIARDWWVPYPTDHSRCPVWDLVCQIDVEGEPGLLLGQAVTQAADLYQQDRKERPDATMPLRMANDFSVRLRLAEASCQLTQLGFGSFHLSADHHFGLSCRIAYLHKLASEGVPVVLMYLGWLDSPDASGQTMVSTDQVSRLISDYVRPIVPQAFLEQPIATECGTTMRMIVRGLSVRSLRRTVNGSANGSVAAASDGQRQEAGVAGDAGTAGRPGEA